ncbi:carbamoyltransferase HypF [Halomonas ventosae]|uniref:acylphosphatase n=1 Tax=Halomonas ventosae TaxID=229007 RepID=A0A2T0VN89_9GAMM|nr:carbamoyltransferase HypF [Halomonas ventosae]PRY71790.1 hydrogenase expression/formation protein HypD/[NiFe] hydrogenase maturation protein HypF,TIGR00143 [Halomonas ventosae]
MALTTPGEWLDRIRALPRPASGRLRIMNVCGGHERTITHAGLRKVLPDYLELIPGPGCPVCVCPEEDIHAAVALSLTDDVIVATFGDMVRVPCNAPRREPRSLQAARALGGQVVPVASPGEVLALARQHPGKQVVFFAAGFETTTAPIAALLSRTDLPDNLLLLLSARQTWPAIAHLLEDGAPGFDALIAPGHVATIMGAEQWRFVPEAHGLPTAVAGFTPGLILAGLHAVLRQALDRAPRLDNAYPQCVTAAGNRRAQALIAALFEVTDAEWRGIGPLPDSGYGCTATLAERDARRHFPEVFEAAYARRGEMPPGCDCAEVVLGRIRPPQCRLYGSACRPESPVGPCMVSDEGACRIWWSHGVRPTQDAPAGRIAATLVDAAPGETAPIERAPIERAPDQEARRWVLAGVVQGVGFRPFVQRLASRLDLAGQVRNSGGKVVIEAQGSAEGLAAFERALIEEAPRRASPRIARRETLEGEQIPSFETRPSAARPSAARPFVIQQSDDQGEQAGPVHLPLDTPVCPDCLAEMHDPRDRHYRYPFTHCDQCGPRYSVIERLPYDRARTSLAAFPLCPACRREYADPENRRFHAQSIGCPQCGPRLTFVEGVVEGFVEGVVEGERTLTDPEEALAGAIAALDAGRIVAVKGVGGYHLMADAGCPAAVATLRERKHRPHKPLAVMFPWHGEDSLDTVREHARLDPVSAEALRADERPVVLVPLLPGHGLADGIAPGLDEVGVLQPYAPLHHLLLEALGRPLVATSANLAGEPIITDPEVAEARLARVADAFLHHDRPILHPVDDGVRRPIAGRARPLRPGRGSSPLELELPWRLPRAVLAVGAQQKSTVCLAWEARLVLSPHIGELSALRTQQAFARQIETLAGLYGVRPELVLHDAHRGYHSTRWARDSGLACREVAHHHAHAAALCGEHGRFREPTLVFTWDGTGLGPDGTLWGGEALLGRPGHWQHHASFAPFALPGGEAAIREPWRLATTLGWQSGLEEPVVEGTGEELALLRAAWKRRLNAPACSAVGRLFDAAAALLVPIPRVSHEAQAAMRLEALAEDDGEPLELPHRRDPDGVLRCDWRPLIRHLHDARLAPERRAADFHATLVRVLRRQAGAARDATGVETLGLTGGVFQNRRLTEAAVAALEEDGFRVLLHERLPCNDAAISVGQVMECLARLSRQEEV